MDKYQQAVVELQGIEQQLAALVPLQKRRDQLRPFVEMGRALFDTRPASDGNADSRNASSIAVPALTSGKAGSAKAQIISAAKSIIEAEGPMQTKTLLDRIQASGIEVGGVDKTITVSVILSRAKDLFKSDRAAGGWKLIHPHKEENPVDAPTSTES